MSPCRPAITVVVMGYRNEATIGAALRSLADQESDDPFELVVVTSGGDRSADAARSAVPGVTVVESSERLLPGGARNAGVRASSGDIIAFLAADCLAEPGWTAARLAAHRAGHRVVAGAMTAAPPLRPSSLASHTVLFCQRLPGRGSGAVALPDAAAHGLSFDREVLDAIGPFDESMRVGEDTDAAQRLAELGEEIWLEAAVRTAHRGPSDTLAMLRDHHRRGAVSATAAGESLRPTALPRALIGYPVAVAAVSWTTFAIAWRNSPGERLRLVACAPWLVMAVGAGLLGRYRVRLGRGRAGVRQPST